MGPVLLCYLCSGLVSLSLLDAEVLSWVMVVPMVARVVL
jgi:hypothetical protein